VGRLRHRHDRQYGSLGFLVDLQSVRLATMQAPVRLSNRQANDLDGIEEEYLCEETLVVAQESHHACSRTSRAAAPEPIG
jgi:hypothetical protein